MTQAERQSQSRRKILEAAMDEFGARDFDAVTMEAICASHGISKGMMYHYYTGKDELFLACVGHVFQSLLKYVRHDAAALGKQAAFETIKNYFAIRECYFQRHPKEKNIFENALLRTPKHLQEEISRLHQPLFEMNQTFLKGIVLKMQLRGGLRNDQVLQYIECVGTLLPSMLRLYQMPGGLSDLHAMLAMARPLHRGIICRGLAGAAAQKFYIQSRAKRKQACRKGSSGTPVFTKRPLCRAVQPVILGYTK